MWVIVFQDFVDVNDVMGPFESQESATAWIDEFGYFYEDDFTLLVMQLTPKLEK